MYSDYFDIDPTFFPSVSQDLIKQKKVDWRRYYPHESFVKLLGRVEKVLGRENGFCRDVWVEGSYGTGKSYAVLTVKELLEAPAQEVKDYFAAYKELRKEKDLLAKLMAHKESGRIVVAHRFVSSDVKGDDDLFRIMQDEIVRALDRNKCSYKGELTLTGRIADWLSDADNRDFFGKKLQSFGKGRFETLTVDYLLSEMKKRTGAVLSEFVAKILAVAKDANVTAFRLDINGFKEWLADVIAKNGIMLLFIWDEFTEYFENNSRSLTAFQEILHQAESEDFCLMVVTHKSPESLKIDEDDRRKIRGRFLQPSDVLSLPVNMAFKLLADVLQKKKGKEGDWKQIEDTLNRNLKTSRARVAASTGIDESELRDVLPLHPYAALILKHLSSSFLSDQRGMFDYIKAPHGETNDFQSFIRTTDPIADTWNLVTVDLLWDFFYERRGDVRDSVRSILETVQKADALKFNEAEKRVFKTILLLGALSADMKDTVKDLLPCDETLALAFDGTDLTAASVQHIADEFVKKGVLFRRQSMLGVDFYSPDGDGPEIPVGPIVDRLRKQKHTTDLATQGGFAKPDQSGDGAFFGFEGALGLRFAPVHHCGFDDLTRTCNLIKTSADTIPLVFVFATLDEEAKKIPAQIATLAGANLQMIAFVDASATPFGKERWEDYLKNMAQAEFYNGKDGDKYKDRLRRATDLVKQWGREILAQGAFEVRFGSEAPVHCANWDEVAHALTLVDAARFPEAPETKFSFIDTMFKAAPMGKGAECGIKQQVEGTFKSANPNTRLEKFLAGAWGVDRYWEAASTLWASKAKADIDDRIEKAFKKEGRIAIGKVFDLLNDAPYGMRPCNLTAFLMGFFLKEYASDQYSWTNIDTFDVMSSSKLQEMIQNFLKNKISPERKYKETYIVAMSPEEKRFRSATASVFGLDETKCSSVARTRDLMRDKLRTMTFPLFFFKSAAGAIPLKTDAATVEAAVDNFIGVANASNIANNKTELDFALNVGKLVLAKPDLEIDLKALFTPGNALEGMKAYLAVYRDGRLPALAADVGDTTGKYIDALREKFAAAAANWVWNEETCNQRIDSVITEYAIMSASKDVTGKTTSFGSCCSEWCFRLGQLKVSFDAIRNELEDFEPLAEALCELKKTGTVPEDRRSAFLDLLEAKAARYGDFSGRQFEFFEKAGAFSLAKFSPNERHGVFEILASDQFTAPKSDYLQRIDAACQEFAKSQLGAKLRQAWKEKTKTDSPREWSKQHRTPALCLVPTEELARIKRAFDLVNAGSGPDPDVKDALDCLEHATFWDAFGSEAAIEAGFRKELLGKFSTLLKDSNKVRDYLETALSAPHYEWYPSPVAQKQVELMAKHEYDTTGSKAAADKIAGMEPERVKTFLQKLIHDNMNVGIEILESK